METLKTKDYINNYIVEATIKLMHKKAFKDISITEIVNTAGVSRATFYRNFYSKENVIIYLFNKIFNKFKNNQQYTPRYEIDYYQRIISILKIFLEEKEKIKAIIKSHLEYIIIDSFNKEYVDIHRNKEKESDPENNTLLPYAYAGGLSNVLIQWVKTDCQQPIEYVAESIFISVFGKQRYEQVKKELSTNR